MRVSVTGIVQVKKQRTQDVAVKNQVNHYVLLYFNQLLRKTKLKNQKKNPKKSHTQKKPIPKQYQRKFQPEDTKANFFHSPVTLVKEFVLQHRATTHLPAAGLQLSPRVQ